MIASDIAVWIDIAASLAVLVTLVFLLVQIRQTNALMRSEARQAQVINDQEHIRDAPETTEFWQAVAAIDQ